MRSTTSAIQRNKIVVSKRRSIERTQKYEVQTKPKHRSIDLNHVNSNTPSLNKQSIPKSYNSNERIQKKNVNQIIMRCSADINKRRCSVDSNLRRPSFGIDKRRSSVDQNHLPIQHFQINNSNHFAQQVLQNHIHGKISPNQDNTFLLPTAYQRKASIQYSEYIASNKILELKQRDNVD